MSPKNRWRTTAKNITKAVERMAPIDWDAMCAKQARVVLVHEPLGSSGVILYGGILTASDERSSLREPKPVSRTQVGVTWRTGRDYELGLAEAVVEALFPAPALEGSPSPRWEMYAVEGIDYTVPTAAQEPVGRPYVATIGPEGDTPRVYVNAMTKQGLSALTLTPAPIHPESLVVTQQAVPLNSKKIEEAWEDYLEWL